MTQAPVIPKLCVLCEKVLTSKDDVAVYQDVEKGAEAPVKFLCGDCLLLMREITKGYLPMVKETVQ